MAGIYFHIPFCRQACHYCDFHFSTNTSYKSEMLAAMATELELQKDYLTETVETIYFGGGTPSLAEDHELERLLATTFKLFKVKGDAEITLEANPDDLSTAKLRGLRGMGINRLSIGIQSFDDKVLRYLNRAHDSTAAATCVHLAQDVGFENISIDLIYAIPGVSNQQWEENIAKALDLNPVHISSYSLTIEEKTAFGRWAAKGQLTQVPDDTAAQQLDVLISRLEAQGFEQYEVSNFSLPGFHSRHNSSYWRQLPYLGIGPSAHSYNIVSRQYNVSNNHLYLKELSQHKIPATIEKLSRADRVNDYLLTTLRTNWGSNLERLKSEFNYDLMTVHGGYVEHLINNGHAKIENTHFILTRSGRFLADKISADLFIMSEH